MELLNYIFDFEYFIYFQQAVLLIGEQGSAKTVIIKHFISKLNTENQISKCLNLSSTTTPEVLQVCKLA